MKNPAPAFTLVQAHGTTRPTDLVIAFASEIPPAAAGAKLPEHIQWMPPGKHTVTVTKVSDNTPVTHEVDVTAAFAAEVQAAFVAQKALADAGKSDAPFFDFDHDDGIASAHPTEFYWAGSDPKTGGIRAKLQWTRSGARAVVGRDYTRFSPVFAVTDDGQIRAAHGHANMGGLVNRAAFQSIAPLLAKHAKIPSATAPGELKTNKENEPYMKSLMAVLARFGVVTSSDLDEAAAVSQVQAKLTEQSQLSTELVTVKADRDIYKAKATKAEEDLKASRSERATAAYDDAVKAGRLKPQDEAAKTFWINSLTADFVNAKKALDAMAVDPALGTVVEAKGGNGGPAVVYPPAEEPAHLVAARAWAKATGKVGDIGDIVIDYFSANPDAYAEYNKGLGIGRTR